MKPPAGYTKSERKKYRSDAQKAYRNVDLSYKPNPSITDVSTYIGRLFQASVLVSLCRCILVLIEVRECAKIMVHILTGKLKLN